MVYFETRPLLSPGDLGPSAGGAHSLVEKSLKRKLCCDNRDIVKPRDTDIYAGNGSTRGSHLTEYVRVCFIYVCWHHRHGRLSGGGDIGISSKRPWFGGAEGV